MSEYTIKGVMEKIENRRMYLPAIQRKFIWKVNQIETFFDSILKGYPIGLFLFWELNEPNGYEFYEFIRDYNRNANFNPIAAQNLPDDFLAVLDGQQRLSSLYVALQGTYTTVTRNGRMMRKMLYLNLAKEPRNFMEDYEFKFLTREQSENIDENNFWMRVGKILAWNQPGDYYNDGPFMERMGIFLQLSRDGERNILRGRINNIITNLWNKINGERLITSYDIGNTRSIDEVLEIFVRVNSGGTKLSKSDLLFSAIVAHWDNARQNIEDLLRDINQNFDFDTDFIIRSCLFLNDLPIRLRLETLTEGNIGAIRNNWDRIQNAIKRAANLLIEFGFKDKILTSNMAVIPIAHYFFKKGDDYNPTNDDKQKIRSYLIRSLVKQIYGGHSDSVLTNVRNVINNSLENGVAGFPLEDLVNADIAGKSLIIDENTIEDILEYKKGSYIFMVLSLLYPNIEVDRIVFHQDHIHPRSLFTRRRLNELHLEDRYDDWKNKKDMLPNLQLLEGRENQEKSNTPFSEWLINQYPDEEERENFLRENYIPTDIDLSIENFDNFFNERRRLLREELLSIFGSDN